MTRPVLAAIGGLLVLIALVFGQVWTFPFLTWDDPFYVTGNIHVQDGLTLANIAWAFQTKYFGLWHPLAWLSHMLDVSLWGERAGGHHVSSVLLHAAAAVVLFLFLHEATASLWRSLAVSLLFALHPLHVESVAWVAERKDVLVALFFFATLYCHARWVRSGKTVFLVLTYLCALCASLSKPMAVSLPVVLLLTDFWPLRRLRLDTGVRPLLDAIREKWPLFVLAAGLALATLMPASDSGSSPPDPRELFDFGQRLQVASLAYGIYLWQMIWPANLSFYYPVQFPLPIHFWLLPPLLLGVLLVLAWRPRVRRPELLFGLGWYVVTLLPASGIVQIGYYAHADRYSYIPLVGIFIALAWLWPRWPAAAVARALAAGACVLVLLLVSVAAYRQVGHWSSSRMLYQHALEVDPDNRKAHLLLAELLGSERRYELALAHLDRVLSRGAADALDARAMFLRGDIAYFSGQHDFALEQWQAATRLDANFPRPWLRLGTYALQAGNLEPAVDYLERARRAQPGNTDALINLGVAYARRGDQLKALEAYQAAVAAHPKNRTALINLARTHEMLGQYPAARQAYADLLAYYPNDPVGVAARSRLP